MLFQSQTVTTDLFFLCYFDFVRPKVLLCAYMLMILCPLNEVTFCSYAMILLLC